MNRILYIVSLIIMTFANGEKRLVEITFNELTQLQQLVDMGIMIGTDFHPGIKGIGPKTGLKLIREHGTIEAIAEVKGFDLPERLEEIRSLFLEHPTTGEPLPQSVHAVEEDLRDFLQKERGFSEGRVQRALDRLTSVARLRSSSQPTLFDF